MRASAQQPRGSTRNSPKVVVVVVVVVVVAGLSLLTLVSLTLCGTTSAVVPRHNWINLQRRTKKVFTALFRLLNLPLVLHRPWSIHPRCARPTDVQLLSAIIVVVIVFVIILIVVVVVVVVPVVVVVVVVVVVLVIVVLVTVIVVVAVVVVRALVRV